MMTYRSNQIHFAHRNNVWCMIWQIITDADRDTVQAYIRAKLYKRQPEREELVPIPGGWKYTIYEGATWKNTQSR